MTRILFLIRIACIEQMRPIATDGVAWSVYVLCVLVTTISPAKTAEGRIELVLARELSFYILLCCKEILVPSKKSTSLSNFVSSDSGLRKFLHGLSIVATCRQL